MEKIFLNSVYYNRSLLFQYRRNQDKLFFVDEVIGIDGDNMFKLYFTTIT